MATRPINQQDDRRELAEHVDKWATFVLSNILWVIVCIPIVTIPAATAGLFAVMSALGRGKQPELFHDFFGAMRRLWLKATLIVLGDVVLGGLLLLNGTIFTQMDFGDPLAFLSRSATVFVAALLLLTNLYLWSLLVLVDLPLKGLIEASIRLGFAYPLWSLGLLVVVALPVGFSLLLPQGFFVLATVSGCALITTMGTWRVIRRHLPENEG